VFNKYLPLTSIILLALLVAGNILIQSPREAAQKEAFTFSNTGTWDVRLLKITEKSTLYPEGLFATIALPPFPKNSSSETTREIALLHSYRALRTPRAVEDIVTEVMTRKIYVEGHTIEDYSNPSLFPATAALLADSMHDLQIIEMQQKQKFDRVRPSVLDPSLDTALVVPGHPAYPSYHATEMYFYAHVFSELAPARRATFFARAEQVSKNREIAGVHYPSDTVAGILLAEQFFNIMMQNEKFLTLLAAAKEEWTTHPVLLQAQANP